MDKGILSTAGGDENGQKSWAGQERSQQGRAEQYGTGQEDRVQEWTVLYPTLSFPIQLFPPLPRPSLAFRVQCCAVPAPSLSIQPVLPYPAPTALINSTSRAVTQRIACVIDGANGGRQARQAARSGRGALAKPQRLPGRGHRSGVRRNGHGHAYSNSTSFPNRLH